MDVNMHEAIDHDRRRFFGAAALTFTAAEFDHPRLMAGVFRSQISGKRIHHRVPNASHALPQQVPKAFADAVMEVTNPV